MYQKVKKSVDPKEKKFNEALINLEKVDADLFEKKNFLNQIKEKVNSLNKDLTDTVSLTKNLNNNCDNDTNCSS